MLRIGPLHSFALGGRLPDAVPGVANAVGVSATGAVGGAQAAPGGAPLGVQAVGGVGGTYPVALKTITGVAATGSAGTENEQVDKSALGVQAVAGVGTSVPNPRAVITGVEATGQVNVPASYEAAEFLSGVAATGQVGGGAADVTIQRPSGVANDSNAYTYLNRAVVIPPGTTVTKLWIFLTAAESGTLRIHRRNSAGNYTAVASVAFSHGGGSQYQGFTLASPYVVPNDGLTYHVSTYQGSGGQQTALNTDDYAWLFGNASTTNAGWTEGTGAPAAPSVGYSYLANNVIDKSVAKSISGVSATGVANDNIPRVGPQIVGVSATGAANGVGQEHIEGLSGVQATGHVGNEVPRVGPEIVGVQAVGTADGGAQFGLTFGISGVSATGYVSTGQGAEDVFGPFSNQTGDRSGVTTISRDLLVTAGRRVTGIWIFSDAAYSGNARIYREDISTAYTAVPGAVTSFSHDGVISEFKFFAFTAPVYLPPGFTYRVGIYTSGLAQGCTNNTLSTFLFGDQTGSSTGWTVDTSDDVPSIGVSYAAAISAAAQVGPEIVGVSATGQIGGQVQRAGPQITGVFATGEVAGVGQLHEEPLSGVSATALLGTTVPRIAIAITGVEAIGVASSPADYAQGSPLTGLVATGQVGLTAKVVEKQIDGVSAEGQIGGALGGDLREVFVTGVSAEGQIGVQAKDVSRAVLGVQAVGATGTGVPRVATIISGVEAIGAITNFVDYAKGQGITGVSAVGLVANDFDERTSTGTGNDTGNNTYIDRTLPALSGRLAGGIWLWSDVAYSGVLKIFREVTLGVTYAPLAGASAAFSHPGGSQWAFFSFNGDIAIPDDGANYYPSVYSASTIRGTRVVSSGDVYRAAGDVSVETTGWTADTEPPSIGIQYRSKATSQVSAVIQGVSATGIVADTETPFVRVAISGVSAAGQVAALKGQPLENLLGLQAVGMVGSFPNYLVNITLQGVQAIGYPSAATEVSFIIKRRRVFAMTG